MMRATSRSAWPAKTDARNFVCFRGAQLIRFRADAAHR
jgi:hypothetical protein